MLSIFRFLTLGGLPLGQRSPKAEMTYCPPRSTTLKKFQPDRAKDRRDMRYQIFQFSALGGLTPGPKCTKRGDDLLNSEVYHRAKFHRSTPTHARDIPYKISCGHTHKNEQETSTPVNPTGVYPHMPIAVTAPFVTLTFNLSRSSKVKPMGPTP